MEETLKIIAALIGAGGVGALLVTLTRYWLSERRLRQGHDLASNQQSFEHMTATIARQEKRIMHLEAKHAECLEKHEECLKENAKVREDIGRLVEAVTRLEGVRLIGNVVVNADGIIVEWDAGAMQIFHWSRAEAVGKPLSIIVPARYLEDHEAAFKDLMLRRRVMRTLPLDVVAQRKDGKEVPVSIVLSEAWQESGELRVGASVRSR